MLLGQLVAVSTATSLFITALALHPRTSLHPDKAPVTLWLPLVLALATIYRVPQSVGTDMFLNNLLWMHGLLIIPLFTSPEAGFLDVPFPILYTLLTLLASAIHIPNTVRLLGAVPTNRPILSHLYQTIFTHPAQSSISLDVIWVVITASLWFLTTGSTSSIGIKAVFAAITAGVAITSWTGVNWVLVASLIPISGLAAIGGSLFGLQRLRTRNKERRRKLLDSMGMAENSVIAGTDQKPPSKSGTRTVVGFWHPYW